MNIEYSILAFDKDAMSSSCYSMCSIVRIVENTQIPLSTLLEEPASDQPSIVL